MRRRTFDVLVSTGGLILAAVLLAAGILLTWGHSFVSSEVHSQLAAQKIVFPTRSNAEFRALPKADQAAMGRYAGQLMTNGAQAETYANHFIAYHLSLLPDHGLYSQLSAASRANPKNAALAALTDVSFKGTTLRSMLLNAWGFWQMGQIALVAAVAAYIGAGLMLILSLLGFWHLRRAAPEAEVFPKLATRLQSTAS